MRLLIDAHLDLALNAINYDRDLSLPLARLNEAEAQMDDQPFRGRATVTLPEMRRAGVAVCIVTLLARSGPRHERQARYGRSDLDHATREGAHCACHAQLAYYRLLEARGDLRMIRTAGELDLHWSRWRLASSSERATLPIGTVLSMEGADPILSVADLDYWWGQGLRAIGLSHYGYGRYAAGTAVEGPLTADGAALLAHMQRLGMALDVTHLADQSMVEALNRFEGHVWASHHNCRALVPWQRQLTDEQMRRLVERNAVIGIAFDAIMLYRGWVRGQTSSEVLDISAAADHVDHICQIAGGVQHVGIGTDLDGGYGTEQTPRDLKSIADVHKLADILSARGYNSSDLDAIFHGNWLRKLRQALPRENDE
jgi:membrane dipeptidase